MDIEGEENMTEEEKKKELKKRLRENKLGAAKKEKEEEPYLMRIPCSLPESTNVFEELTRVMHAILSFTRNKNLKVKRLVIYKLLPVIVNKAQSFMEHSHSARFMVLIDDAMQVNWGDKQQQEKATTELLKLHMDFLNNDGVILKDHETLTEIIHLLSSLKRFKKDPRHEIVTAGLNITLMYLQKIDE